MNNRNDIEQHIEKAMKRYTWCFRPKSVPLHLPGYPKRILNRLPGAQAPMKNVQLIIYLEPLLCQNAKH